MLSYFFKKKTVRLNVPHVPATTLRQMLSNNDYKAYCRVVHVEGVKAAEQQREARRPRPPNGREGLVGRCLALQAQMD